MFQRACLIQLQTSCWQGMTTLGSGLMEKVGNSEWLKGAKILIDPESLLPVRSVISKARVYLSKSALPFPVFGLTLVPKEIISEMDTDLRGFQEEFKVEVENFIRRYDDERHKAKMSLGDLFSDTDYPIDIRGKFRFQWRFMTLDVPTRSGILTPEIYEREKEKFRVLMDETRELATVALREEFAGMIRHMAERLNGSEDGKPKKFKSSMIGKMHEFLDTFENRNIFCDDTLSDLVSQARDVVSGLSPEELRKDENLRHYIAGEMSQLRNAIDGAIEDLPRRKIRLAA